MKREFVRNLHFLDDVKPVSASVIEKWGFDHGFRFPKDFIDFFSMFGGAYLDESFGYEFTYENDDRPVFAIVTRFFHFDQNVVRNSVDDVYMVRCKDNWDQPLLVPFADTEVNTFAVLDYRKSTHAPPVYNVDFFDTSEDDPDRPNMTLLADSFTGFLEILEREEDYDARVGE